MTVTTPTTIWVMQLKWPEAAKWLYSRNMFGNMAINSRKGVREILAHFGKTNEEYAAYVEANLELRRDDFCGVCGQFEMRTQHFEPAPHDCPGPQPRREIHNGKWVIVVPGRNDNTKS